MDEKQKQIIENLQKDLDNERKTNQKMMILVGCLSALTVLCFCFGALLLAILFMLSAAGIWYLIFMCRGSVGRMENDLRMAKSDPEKYEWQMHIRSIDAQVQIRQNQSVHNAQHPQCPMCGSQNTQRISTLSRTASVAAVGLASSKIGKQFECKNCKCKW